MSKHPERQQNIPNSYDQWIGTIHRITDGDVVDQAGNVVPFTERPFGGIKTPPSLESAYGARMRVKVFGSSLEGYNVTVTNSPLINPLEKTYYIRPGEDPLTGEDHSIEVAEERPHGLMTKVIHPLSSSGPYATMTHEVVRLPHLATLSEREELQEVLYRTEYLCVDAGITSPPSSN